jgi:hypothetical protein
MIGIEISRVPHCANSFRALRQGSEFLPKIADVHINGPVKDAKIAAQGSGQTVTAHNLSGINKKQVQNVELCGRKVYRDTSARHRPGGRVKSQVAELHDMDFFLGRLKMTGPRTPQHGLDSGNQFSRKEGFGKVIVSTQLKANYPVDFLALRREHDDMHL